MNSTLPLASCITLAVALAVCPTKPEVRSLALISTTSAVGSSPSEWKSCPILRATVVLPVPGEPTKRKLNSTKSLGSEPSLLAHVMVSLYSRSLSRIFPTPTRSENMSSSPPAVGSTPPLQKSSFSSLSSARCPPPLWFFERVWKFSLAVESRLLTAPALPKLGMARACASCSTANSAVGRSTASPSLVALARRIRTRDTLS
mmetsp:Transcript_25996/g.57531  ORF Transcript_25996/g.57531 Transcript_25996/m.57531 type:complete len:202 (-) Transcript_25996:1983-2588(-)